MVTGSQKDVLGEVAVSTSGGMTGEGEVGVVSGGIFRESGWVRK